MAIDDISVASADPYSAGQSLQQAEAPSPELAKAIAQQKEPVSTEMIVWLFQLMERQKEQVDALLLVIKDQLDRGTFAYTLADLAKSIQEDHKCWYELQDRLGISERMSTEVNHG
ncbi:hypothetical protein CSC67_10545 [Pusillimonas caeni]|uniref:hypothetical protein n=1 Tax=Pusillimonas caeni TaxID=1348472 RepID=UPI000E59F6BD|nr:hypothetical protein [Pusillimonas caeni]TFL13690.1 hypothetical protein CSC67_10545 [Pusillimonas caeni]